MWIENTFPSLTGTEFNVASEATDQYNCIAWAVGDTSAWWCHLPGYRWPAQRTPDIESLVAVFVSVGYEVCETGNFEERYEKVALYVRQGRWSHAARQLDDGQWTSKLGPYEDIQHATVESLCGAMYGELHCIMRRPRQ